MNQPFNLHVILIHVHPLRHPDDWGQEAFTWWRRISPTGRARCEQRWPCSEARGTPTAQSSQRNTGTLPTAGRGTQLWSKNEKEVVNTGNHFYVVHRLYRPKRKRKRTKRQRASTNQPLYSSVGSRRWWKLVYNTGLQENVLFTETIKLICNGCGCILWTINESLCTTMATPSNVS